MRQKVIGVFILNFIGSVLSFGFQGYDLFAEEKTDSKVEDHVLKRSSEEEKIGDLSLSDIFNLKVDVASMFSQSELDAGSSVSVIDPNMWEKLGTRKTLQAITVVPGVEYWDGTFGAGPGIGVRGFPQTSAVSNGKAMLLDGISLNGFVNSNSILEFPNIETSLLDRLEMIRGPGSALYGSDAFQGVISLKTWSPETDTAIGNVRYGSFGYTQASIKASKEVIPDLRITAAYSVSDELGSNVLFPYQQNTYNLERKYNSSGLLLKAKYKNTEAEYLLNQYTSQGYPFIRYFNVSTFTFNEVTESQDDANGQVAKLTSKFDVGNKFEFNPTAFYMYGRSSVTSGTNNGPSQPPLQLISQVERAYGLNMILKRPAEESFPVQFGLGYSLRYSVPIGGDSGSVDQPIPATYIEKSRTVNGVFGETDTGLFDNKLHLLLGGRYDFYSDFGTHFSPRTGLIYHLAEDTVAKLLYGNAFRAPSALELYGGGTQVGNPNLNPEVIDTLELIFMKHSKEWTFTGTGFFNNWQDGVTLIPIGQTGTIIAQNVAQLQSYGAEFEGKYVYNNFNSFGNISYVRSEELQPTPKVLDAFPRFIVNWGLGYDVPSIGLTTFVVNRHEIYRYSGSGELAGTPTKMNDFFRTDVSLAWNCGNYVGMHASDMRLTFSVQDLFDIKNFESSAFDFNPPAGVPLPGRAVTVGLRAQI